MFCGFGPVAVGVDEFGNLQNQDVGLFELISVKLTQWFRQSLVGVAEKFATGGEQLIMVTVPVAVSVLVKLYEIKVTV